MDIEWYDINLKDIYWDCYHLYYYYIKSCDWFDYLYVPLLHTQIRTLNAKGAAASTINIVHAITMDCKIFQTAFFSLNNFIIRALIIHFDKHVSVA